MPKHRWMGHAAAMLLLAATLALGGCRGILDVKNPQDVDATLFDDPSSADLIRLSAIGDFQCAFANYALVSAMWTGEVVRAIDNITYQQWSQRQIEPENSTLIGSCSSMWGTFRVLQTARVQSEEAMRRYAEWNLDTRDAMTAQVAAYAGYSILLLAESYCELSFDGGPLQTRQQALQRADERFTTAIAAATAVGDAATLNLALMGRARTRLNLGRGAEAVADAELVPRGFVLYSEGGASGATTRSNWFWQLINNSSNITVPEDYRGLQFDGVTDPRVSAAYSGHQSINGVPVWNQLKYPARISDIPLAKWEEAQLIIAEVEGGETAVDIINDLHDDAGLPHFASTDPDEIRAQVIEERRRALWLEGKRLGDMLRLGVPFPQGTDYQGMEIHTQTCIPLPKVERVGNPNID